MSDPSVDRADDVDAAPGDAPRARRPAPSRRLRLGVAVLALAPLALLPLPGEGPSSPSALEAAALAITHPFTREESVRISVDGERRMVLDASLHTGRAARDDGWLVLDRRWLDGDASAAGGGRAAERRLPGEGSSAVGSGVARMGPRRTEALARDAAREGAVRTEKVTHRALSYVGAVMGEDAHVAITPPFVVLTRGGESLLVRLDGRPLIGRGEPTPDWVRADAERGTVLARFDGFSGVEIGAGTVRLQRRFFGW